MKTLIYIDDNPEKIKQLKENLTDFRVRFFTNPIEAHQQLPFIDYDVLILDIMMPFMDGFQLYEKVIEMDNYKSQPIFFHSETMDEALMVRALTLGVCELLSPQMPWSVKRQRILNKLDDSKSGASDEINGFQLDFLKMIITSAGKSVVLTSKEMAIFKLVLENPNSSKEVLLSKAWGENVSMSRNNLATHLTNLNKKINCFDVRVKTKKGNLTLINTIPEHSASL